MSILKVLHDTITPEGKAQAKSDSEHAALRRQVYKSKQHWRDSDHSYAGFGYPKDHDRIAKDPTHPLHNFGLREHGRPIYHDTVHHPIYHHAPEHHSKPSQPTSKPSQPRSNRNKALAGAGIALAASGAAYGAHRYKKKRDEEKEDK